MTKKKSKKDLGFVTIGVGSELERKIKIENVSTIIVPDKKTIRFAKLENEEGYIIQLENLINPETSFHHWIGEETVGCIMAAIFLAQENKAIDINSLFIKLPQYTQTAFQKI